MFNNYVIASLHGIGDLCLVAGLIPAFKAKYCKHGEGVKLICKRSHAYIADAFIGPTDVEVFDDGHAAKLVEYAKRQGPTVHRPILDTKFIAHPEHVYVRPDFCVAKGYMTDVAMYALILGLDPHTPIMAPIVEQADYDASAELVGRLVTKPGKTVVIFPHANSWPAPVGEGFWHELRWQLEAEGFDTLLNDNSTPLQAVIPLIEKAGWVIGANSGIMQFIVQARANCRKTIITPTLCNVSYPLPLPRIDAHTCGGASYQQALPYRSMRTILGDQYDIEEFELEPTPASRHDVMHSIVHGRNAKGPAPARHEQPVYDVPLPPGEIIDRYTILQLKAQRLPQAYMIHRELAFLWNLRLQIYGYVQRQFKSDALIRLENRLSTLNQQAWDDNQLLFDSMTGDDHWWNNLDTVQDYAMTCTTKARDCLAAFRRAGIDANHERVRLKNEINVLCGSFDREEKSYAT
jgi:hypothetical protein